MSKDRLSGRKTLATAGFFEELEKERLKAQVDLVALFASYGVALTRQGKGYRGRCPWHEDSTPSLSVDPAKGLYHCFGCGESGDAFSLVERMAGVGFREALEVVRRLGGNGHEPPPEGALPSERSVAGSLPKESALEAVTEAYHRQLLASPVAGAYLDGRGLSDRRLWSRFRLGTADGRLGMRLSREQREQLTACGLLTAAGKEVLAGYLTVPLQDADGQVVGFYGRALKDATRPAHRYLSGPHRGLFNPDAYRVYRDRLVLTESVLDALSLVQLGVQNVSACYGAGGLTDVHRAALLQAGVAQVVLAFDADEAGRAGAEKLAGELAGLGLAVARIEPPAPAKDWNAWLTAGAATKEAFQALLEAAAVEAAQPTERLEVLGEQHGTLRLSIGDRSYRLVASGGSLEGAALRVSLWAERGVQRTIDHVDLYSARSRASFAAAVARVWPVEPARIEADLLSMLDLLEARRESRFSQAFPAAAPVEVSAAEREAALEFLTSADLFERLERDLDTVGYVGEGVNKRLLYLAASSRLLDDPISVLVVSESAAGKSALIEAVRRLLPHESVLSMTSLSDQALHYLPEDGLLHKFLVMGEARHAEPVELQIREMLSAHELTRLVTLKDAKTGELESRTVRKKVIVAAALSSTDYSINPENASRFFIVHADESEAQTARIHAAQRRKYSVERLAEQERTVPAVIARHQAAQRLLAKHRIVNPFAASLSFPTHQMRARRDHERFLDLIAAVCHLRQFQKERRKARLEDSEEVEYIECDLTDYRIAYRILAAVLSSTLSTFPRGAEALYGKLRELVRQKAAAEGLRPEEVGFSQREVREATGATQRWVKRYLAVLADYEYLQVVGPRQRGSRYGYRLVADVPRTGLETSWIPRPEEIEAALQNVQSGPGGPAVGQGEAGPLSSR